MEVTKGTPNKVISTAHLRSTTKRGSSNDSRGFRFDASTYSYTDLLEYWVRITKATIGQLMGKAMIVESYDLKNEDHNTIVNILKTKFSMCVHCYCLVAGRYSYN